MTAKFGYVIILTNVFRLALYQYTRIKLAGWRASSFEVLLIFWRLLTVLIRKGVNDMAILESILIALFTLVVVFSVIALLWAVIRIFSSMIQKVEKRKEESSTNAN